MIHGREKMSRGKKKGQSINNENNTEKKKIDWWLVIKEVIYVATSVLTIAASIATCYTIHLMRDERNQAYKPYFIFRTASYEQEVEQLVYPIDNVSNLIEAQQVDEEQLVPMTILLENIGSGTATNIDVSFDCGMEKDYMETICEPYYDSQIELTDEELKVEYYSLYWEQMLRFEYPLDDIEWSFEKSYIYTKEGVEIDIPESYRKMLYVLAYCTNGEYDMEDIPSIKVGISYNDLQGIDYYEEIILKAEVYVETNADQEKNYVKYVIEEL